MWNRIFLIALAVAAVPMIFLTYYSYTWLQSVGSPIDALNGFRNASSIAFFWLWISTAVLIVLANIVLWNYQKAWALWTTLLYLAVFLLLRALWLDPASFSFISSHNLPLDRSVFGPFVTLIVAAAAAALVYFNQLLVHRMTGRLYPPGIEADNEGVEAAEPEAGTDAANDESP